MEKEILAVLNTLLSSATFTDFKVLSEDIVNHPQGFYICVPAGGGTVIGKTWQGNDFNTTFGEGYHPIKMKSITFTGTVAGLKVCFK